jgi:phage head maturation protease/cation transport regulator ChaB
MPYASTAELPAPVKAKLKGKKRRQWMHVFNSEHAVHGDESRAFASAWAATKKTAKAKTPDAGYGAFKAYVEDKTKTIGKAAAMNEFQFYMPIAKVEKGEDGTCIVSGYASTPTKDSDGEIVTLEAVKKALPGYMQWRNIREMHQLKAVGKAQEANVDKKGLWLSAKISDPTAVQKCVDQVYQGFSIGGKKLDTQGSKITEIELTEISVVDRPANPDAKFTVAKSMKSVTSTDGGFLLAVPKRTPAEKALTKMAKIVSSLAKNNPPAAHDGFSLPAKPDTNPSPKDSTLENNKGIGPAPCDAHGKINCPECMEKREFTESKRQELAASGKALPDGSFPIENKKDVENAVRLRGHASDPAAAKAHIIRHAKALDAEDALPDEWKPKTKKKKDKVARKLAKMQLAEALDISGESFLYLKGAPQVKPSPLTKGMGAAGDLSYAFDSLRRIQRSLLLEAQREGGDMKDKSIAKEVGKIAQQISALIGQKATHEGGEALDLSDADDKYVTSSLGEGFNMDKIALGGSGDPLADAVAALMQKAATPSRMQRMEMAKTEIKKARKACKMAKEAIEEAHKMHKAAYMAKAAKGKDGAKDDAGEFDHAGAMEKLQKAHAAVTSARTFGKAASGQLEKAAARSGQRGQEAGDSDSGFYEVPAGVKDLSPAALAGASPGGDGSGGQPPMYPDDGSVYPGKAAGADFKKFAKNGQLPVEIAELLMKGARDEAELEVLRRMPVGGGGNKPYTFDLTKVVGGTGGARNTADLNKALFSGVDVTAFGSGDERRHTAASALTIGNLLTSGVFAKSVLSPDFHGAAGSK